MIEFWVKFRKKLKGTTFVFVLKNQENGTYGKITSGPKNYKMIRSRVKCKKHEFL